MSYSGVEIGYSHNNLPTHLCKVNHLDCLIVSLNSNAVFWFCTWLSYHSHSPELSLKFQQRQPTMPAGTKRKRTAKKSGSASRKDGSISKKSRIDLHERQYFQGLSGSDFGPWFGCGSSLLQTPSFTFQSPVDGLMRFEIDSGENPEGPGEGLRLYVPCDNLKDVVNEPTFMVPFQHVGQ